MSKDRSDREKIAKIIHLKNYSHRRPPWEVSWENDKQIYRDACFKLADQIIALLPDKKDIEKQERERIIEWSKEDCPHMERTPASKSHCYKCWQALRETNGR